MTLDLGEKGKEYKKKMQISLRFLCQKVEKSRSRFAQMDVLKGAMLRANPMHMDPFSINIFKSSFLWRKGVPRFTREP